MYSYHRIHILFILKFVHSFHCIHISHNHICIFDSPNPYICIIAHVFPHYQIRISLPHFVCVFLYAGAINRTPTAADGLQQRCEQIAIYTRTPTKCPQNIPQYTHVHPRNAHKTFRNIPTSTHETPQNIPPGVGADSSRPYPYISKNAYSHYRIRISTLPNMHFRFITHTFPFAISCVFTYMRAR